MDFHRSDWSPNRHASHHRPPLFGADEARNYRRSYDMIAWEEKQKHKYPPPLGYGCGCTGGDHHHEHHHHCPPPCFPRPKWNAPLPPGRGPLDGILSPGGIHCAPKSPPRLTPSSPADRLYKGVVGKGGHHGHHGHDGHHGHHGPNPRQPPHHRKTPRSPQSSKRGSAPVLSSAVSSSRASRRTSAPITSPRVMSPTALSPGPVIGSAAPRLGAESGNDRTAAEPVAEPEIGTA